LKAPSPRGTIAHAGIKGINHPDVGALRIAFEALRLADDEQLLVTWLPADEVTAAGLRRATATDEPVSPAQPRIVAVA